MPCRHFCAVKLGLFASSRCVQVCCCPEQRRLLPELAQLALRRLQPLLPLQQLRGRLHDAGLGPLHLELAARHVGLAPRRGALLGALLGRLRPAAGQRGRRLLLPDLGVPGLQHPLLLGQAALEAGQRLLPHAERPVLVRDVQRLLLHAPHRGLHLLGAGPGGLGQLPSPLDLGGQLALPPGQVGLGRRHVQHAAAGTITLGHGRRLPAPQRGFPLLQPKLRRLRLRAQALALALRLLDAQLPRGQRRQLPLQLLFPGLQPVGSALHLLHLPPLLRKASRLVLSRRFSRGGPILAAGQRRLPLLQRRHLGRGRHAPLLLLRFALAQLSLAPAEVLLGGPRQRVELLGPLEQLTRGRLASHNPGLRLRRPSFARLQGLVGLSNVLLARCKRPERAFDLRQLVFGRPRACSQAVLRPLELLLSAVEF